MSSATADEIIRLFDLGLHAEGGFFRKTHRDRLQVGGVWMLVAARSRQASSFSTFEQADPAFDPSR